MSPEHRTQDSAEVRGFVLDGGPTLVRIIAAPLDPDAAETLVRDLLAAVTGAGGTALTARGGPVEQELALAVIAQLCGDLPALSPATGDALLRGDNSALPGMTEVLTAAEAGPLLLVVRDAHWLDAESLDWLRALVRRMPGRALTLVLSGADGPELRETQVGTGVRSLDFRTEQRDAVPVDDRSAARLVARLEPAVLAVLRGAAIADGLLDLPTLATLADADSVSATSLREAITASGLTGPGANPKIRDDALRHRLLATISEQRRGELHTAIATHAYLLAADNTEVGRVLLGAPPLGQPWVRTVLAHGSRLAQQRGDHELAAQLLTRALAEPTPTELDRLRLSTELAATEVPVNPLASDQRLAEILTAAEGPSTGLRIRAADLLLARGDSARVRRALAESSANWWPRETAPDRDAHILLGLFWQADYPDSAPADIDRADVPDLAEPAVEPGQAAVLALRLAMSGVDRARCVRLATSALACPDPHGAAPIMPMLAACRVLGFADHEAEAEAGYDRLLVIARQQGAVAAEALALAFRADLAVRGGRLDTAERDMAQARATLPYSAWHSKVWPYPIGIDIALHLLCGRQSEARDLAMGPVPAGARDGAKWSVMLYARGLVALHDGDLPQAKELLLATTAHQRAHGEHNPLVLPSRHLLAEAYRLLGERDLAMETLAEERHLLSQWSGLTTLTNADVELAAITENGGEQVANAFAAVCALRVSPAKLSYAYALVQLASALLDADPNHDVTGQLDEAESIIGPYPCHRLRTQIKRLDEQHGIARGAAAVAHPEWAQLSPAEQRIVAMAAQGHANGDIAEKFAITKRTVEVHLTRAYRKLRISGRAELPGLVKNVRR